MRTPSQSATIRRVFAFRNDRDAVAIAKGKRSAHPCAFYGAHERSAATAERAVAAPWRVEVRRFVAAAVRVLRNRLPLGSLRMAPCLAVTRRAVSEPVARS